MKQLLIVDRFGYVQVLGYSSEQEKTNLLCNNDVVFDLSSYKLLKSRSGNAV
jgi:hypothetical protein